MLTCGATLVPPKKTCHGVVFHGYDWTASVGQPPDWIKATKIATQESVKTKRSESDEAMFTYSDGKTRYTSTTRSR